MRRAKGCHREGDVLVVRQVHELGLEIHGDLGLRTALDQLEQGGMRAGSATIGSRPILERVLPENVGKL